MILTMKRINKYISLVMAFLVITSCTEDEKVLPTIDLENGEFVSSAFTSAETGTTVLEFANADNVYEVLTWSDASYDGVSIPVSYTVEAATDEAFSSPVTLASDLKATSLSLTVNQMNGFALGLGLTPFEASNINVRVTSSVDIKDLENLVSPAITRTVTPYVTEFESIYMVGAGVGGWDLALAVETYGTGPSEYSVIAQFIAEGDANFRFIETEDWNAASYNYDFFASGTIDPLFENNMDDDNNFKFVGTTGYYRINVDLKAPSVTMEFISEDAPTLYMVGSGAPEAGWSWDTPVAFTWVQDGVFEATTEFLQNDGMNELAFRFFTIEGDWNSGRNYPYYSDLEYDIDSKLANAGDGDNNFMLTAESGTYQITINDIEKTITLDAAGTAGPPKYLVGDGTSAGWDWASPVELVQVEVGIFKGTTDFNGAGAFRVFSTNGDWDSGTNFPTFIADDYTITSDFVDAGDGDNNFKFTGTDGTYVFVLNENDKTITLEFPSVGDPKYLVGDGTQAGWAWENPVVLNQTESGVFKAFVDLNTAGAFRIFSANGDWDSGVNFPTYVADGYTITSDFVDAGDGDSNFKFAGTDGRFIFVLDDNNKTITLE